MSYTQSSYTVALFELCCLIVCDFTCNVAKCFVLLPFRLFRLFVVCAAFYSRWIKLCVYLRTSRKNLFESMKLANVPALDGTGNVRVAPLGASDPAAAATGISLPRIDCTCVGMFTSRWHHTLFVYRRLRLGDVRVFLRYDVVCEPVGSASKVVAPRWQLYTYVFYPHNNYESCRFRP